MTHFDEPENYFELCYNIKQNFQSVFKTIRIREIESNWNCLTSYFIARFEQFDF